MTVPPRPAQPPPLGRPAPPSGIALSPAAALLRAESIPALSPPAHKVVHQALRGVRRARSACSIPPPDTDVLTPSSHVVRLSPISSSVDSKCAPLGRMVAAANDSITARVGVAVPLVVDAAQLVHREDFCKQAYTLPEPPFPESNLEVFAHTPSCDHSRGQSAQNEKAAHEPSLPAPGAQDTLQTQHASGFGGFDNEGTHGVSRLNLSSVPPCTIIPSEAVSSPTLTSECKRDKRQRASAVTSKNLLEADSAHLALSGQEPLSPLGPSRSSGNSSGGNNRSSLHSSRNTMKQPEVPLVAANVPCPPLDIACVPPDNTQLTGSPGVMVPRTFISDEPDGSDQEEMPMQLVVAQCQQVGKSDAIVPRAGDVVAAPIRRSSRRSSAQSGKSARLLAPVATLLSVARRPRAAREAKVEFVKSVTFSDTAGLRCAVAVGAEVWTADWGGHVRVRDPNDVERVVGEVPTKAMTVCMVLVGSMYPMVWLGQETTAISVYDAVSRELLCNLTGGHTGNVLAFAVATNKRDLIDVWSASNDFSIRCWHVEPKCFECSNDVFVVPGLSGRHIRRGAAMRDHTNMVQSLLVVGSALWSGSQDRSIRLWRRSDASCMEVVGDAHESGVLSMVISGDGVWSAGYDGYLKEWSFSGGSHVCTRFVKFDAPLRTLLLVGENVWLCGMSSKISVCTQKMKLIEDLEGHTSYISSLGCINHVDVTTVWSNSFGDRTLRVWRQVKRNDGPSIVELKLINRILEKQCLHAEERVKQVVDELGLAKAKQEELATQRELLCMRFEDISVALHIACKRTDEAHQSIIAAASRAESAEAQRIETVKRLEESLSIQKRQALALGVAEKEHVNALSVAEELRSKLALATVDATAQKKRSDDLEALLDSERLRHPTEVHAMQQEHSAVLKRCQEQISTLESQMVEYQAENERLRECSRKLAGAESELEVLRPALQRAQSELDEANAKLGVFEGRCTAFQCRLDDVARGLTSIDHHLDVFRNETKDMYDWIRKLPHHEDRQEYTTCLSRLGETFLTVRGQLRQVIAACFSGKQRLHAGANLAGVKRK